MDLSVQYLIYYSMGTYFETLQMHGDGLRWCRACISRYHEVVLLECSFHEALHDSDLLW